MNRANNADTAAFALTHCNSAESAAAHGTKVYHYTGSEAGRKLARVIHRPVVRAASLADRGVKSTGFCVLKHTKMPAVLAEPAFMSSENEEGLPKDENFQAKAARAITGGIVAWMRGTHASLGWLTYLP